jgi:hypothetical protein
MCHQYKFPNEFYKEYTTKLGISTYCKECCKLKNRGRVFRKTHSITAVYGNYIRGAKVRGIPFELDINDVGTLIHADCYYCKRFPKEVNGIDRFDNTKGYTTDNCVPCCSDCNYLKNNTSPEEFAQWILDLYPWAKKYMRK